MKMAVFVFLLYSGPETLVWHLCGDLKSLKQNWAVTCDFQQCGILTSVDLDEPVQSS